MMSKVTFVAAGFGWLAYVASLFMPALAVAPDRVLPGLEVLFTGWMAFTVAVMKEDPLVGLGLTLGQRAGFLWWGISWLTNVVMLVSPVWVFTPTAARTRSLMVVSLILNATLLAPFWPEMTGQLRLGYYFWLASFFFLSVGVLARSSRPAGSGST